MIRGGHVALVAALGFGIHALCYLFWGIAVFMLIVLIVQRVRGYRPERRGGDGIYYVPERAPERLPEIAPRQIV